MARLLRHFIETPRPCSYLPDERASLEYRLMVAVTPDELERLLARGWRRFGPAYFRPACVACFACDSVRLDVTRFQPTPSQKRALRRTRRFRLVEGPPTIDAERLALHERWHHTREEARGWEPSGLTADDYATQFAFPSATGREVAWYDGERLVALSLLDVTPASVSAAYFFYEPSIARLSPGVGNVMQCVELAHRLGRRHLYLGYRVEGCASLAYKGLFRPYEMLDGRPDLEATPVWREVAAGATRPDEKDETD